MLYVSRCRDRVGNLPTVHWVCAVNRGSLYTTSQENVYRSWAELLSDVEFGMKDIQLVGLRASERYGCMLRNTVEVQHVYDFLSADFMSIIPYQTSDLEENKLFKYEKPSWSLCLRQTLRQNSNSHDNIMAEDPRQSKNRVSQKEPLLSRHVSPTVARV